MHSDPFWNYLSSPVSIPWWGHFRQLKANSFSKWEDKAWEGEPSSWTEYHSDRQKKKKAININMVQSVKVTVEDISSTSTGILVIWKEETILIYDATRELVCFVKRLCCHRIAPGLIHCLYFACGFYKFLGHYVISCHLGSLDTVLCCFCFPFLPNFMVA